MRFWYKSIYALLAKVTGFFYKCPINFSYWWNFGFLSFFVLILQIFTGVLIAMYYDPNIIFTQNSIINIDTEIYYGWWIRYLHVNGSSLFFFFVYLHIFRGLFYGSYLYPRQILWMTGALSFLLMIIISFLGYVLPWGQMSYWAAIVITNLVATIPLLGKHLIFIVWSAYTVESVTLYKFYVLHIVLPFILLLTVIWHLLSLHESGSNNRLGIKSTNENIPFTPYYTLKDAVFIIFLFLVLSILIFFIPFLLTHVLNFEIANYLVTPIHIVPEWYFWFFFALLRSIPNKELGVLCLVFSLITLLLMPFISKTFLIKSITNKPWHYFWFCFLICICFVMSFIGSIPILYPYTLVGQFLVFFYFLIMLVFLPLGGHFENFIAVCIANTYYLKLFLKLDIKI